MEQWKSLSSLGYPNYKISNTGRISNIKTGYKLKGSIQHGYRGVKIPNIEGKVKFCPIHRLVALIFLGKPDDKKLSVDHINRDKLDNRVQNLRWATHSLQIKNRIQKNPKSFEVLQYDLKDNFIRSWKSAKEAAETLDFKRNGITQCCNGYHTTYKKFKWKYPDVVIDPTEIWKIIDREKFGMVMVSNKGRIKRRSIQPNFGNISNGYYYAQLKNINTGMNYNTPVHRLVAKAFLDNYDSNLVVNHKNGNKLDNNVGNLEFLTRQQNTVHAYLSGLVGSPKQSKPVLLIDPKTNKIIEYYNTIEQAHNHTKITVKNIKIGCENYPQIVCKYIWAYSFNPLVKDLIQEFMKTRTKKEKDPMVIANYEAPIVKIHPTKNIVIGYYANVKSAAEKHNIRPLYIVRVLSGHRKVAYGYFWSYINENVQPMLDTYDKLTQTEKDQLKRLRTNKRFCSVVRLDQKTGEISGFYKTITDAAKDNLATGKNISEFCRGISNNGGGHKWCYADEFDKELLKEYALSNNIKLYP